jgi:hypothetical protein
VLAIGLIVHKIVSVYTEITVKRLRRKPEKDVHLTIPILGFIFLLFNFQDELLNIARKEQF